jgi:hypothetical protein
MRLGVKEKLQLLPPLPPPPPQLLVQEKVGKLVLGAVSAAEAAGFAVEN